MSFSFFFISDVTDDNRWSRPCGCWLAPWWQPALSVVTFCTQLDNYLMYWSTMVHQQQSWYIKRNTNFDVHYDTLAWRSFNIWEFLKYFCQYLKIESAILPEAGSIQNYDFPSSWWNDMSESVRQKNSLGKASEKSARRSIVTGRNYYLSIKIHSKKSELKFLRQHLLGEQTAGPSTC